MFQIAVGQSDDVDSDTAIEEVLAQCRARLPRGCSPQVGLLYAAIDLDHRVLLDAIQAAFPGLPLVGCTTDGELSTASFQEDSVVLTLFCSDSVRFEVGSAKVVGEDVAGQVKQAVQAHGCEEVPALCLLFPPGFVCNGAEVVRSFDDAFAGQVPLAGGMAGDQWRFAKTLQFLNGDILTDEAPFLLMYGVACGMGVASGWNPLGRLGVVTRSEGNLLYDIDERPANAFFQHYIGQRNTPVPDNPLAVQESEKEAFYLRAPLGVDDAHHCVVFAGDVPEGAKVQLTQSTRDGIVAACSTALQAAIEHYSGHEPTGVLCVSCACRKQVLGTRTEDELAAVRKCFPGIPVSGFYSYGEIGPAWNGGGSFFHNETFVVILLGDA